MHRLVLFGAMAAGCADPEAPCDAAGCPAVCAEGVAAYQEAVPEGGTLLSAFEYRQLLPLLSELRRGVGVLDSEMGFCEGTERCERFVAHSTSTPHPAGNYILQIPLTAPAVGRWVAEATWVCDANDGKVTTGVQRASTVVPHGEEPFVWLPFKVSGMPFVDATVDTAVCRFELVVPGARGEPVTFRGQMPMERAPR